MPAHLLKLLTTMAGATPDAELLARFTASRDETAFAELVRRHGPLVWRICRRLAGPSSADDAFQATFLILACRAKSVRKAASVGSWLSGVAGRVARQMQKRDRRANNDCKNIENLVDPADASRSPELNELAAILDDELARLPGHLRDPLVLCLVNGRTQEQAAAAIGGSVRTVRRRLERAKAVLRARLERRGVIPALAVASIASIGTTTGAATPELIHRTVSGVFQFLTVGAATPAAILAKGVVMGTAKMKLAGGIAAVAAVAFGLGIGPAGDSEKPIPMAQPTPAMGPVPLALNPPTQPTGAESPLHVVPFADSGTIAPPTGTAIPPGAAGTHRTANFIVYAPTDPQARMIASEAEYWRKQMAKTWCGRELPKWATPCTITFGHDEKIARGRTEFTFKTTKVSGMGEGMETAQMSLTGPFLMIAEGWLRQEVMRVVLTAQLGKRLPRWVDEGFPLLMESAAVQAFYDGQARSSLGDGRAFRLKRLFTMTEAPRAAESLYSQGHSIARFLATREVKIAGKAENPQESGLLLFVKLGQNGDWDAAAKRVYGFESVDALEAAWLEWMKKPESRLTGGPIPASQRPTAPDLIPATIVPGVDQHIP